MKNFVWILAAVVAVVAGVWVGSITQDQQQTADQAPAIQGAIYTRPRPLSNVHLTAPDTSEFTEQNLKGHWTLIFVGYTNCPDVCPTTLSVLAQVSKLMQEQGLAPPRVVFISIDPERDKPEMINEYVRYFDKNFTGITGDKASLDQVTRQLNVVYAKAPGVDGSMTADNYLMDHSSSLILLNPDVQVQAVLTAPHTPMKIIDSIVKTQFYYYE